MTATDPIRVLISEIDRGLAVLSRIEGFYQDYIEPLHPLQSRQTDQVIVLADILVSYYTCLETLCPRISQFFENSLADEKWHRDLLRKMSLEIPGIRERVLSDATAQLLEEIMKFRHFKRYYFEFNCDWDRLEYLVKRFGFEPGGCLGRAMV
jgi:hypothetical protein